MADVDDWLAASTNIGAALRGAGGRARGSYRVVGQAT